MSHLIVTIVYNVFYRLVVVEPSRAIIVIGKRNTNPGALRYKLMFPAKPIKSILVNSEDQRL